MRLEFKFDGASPSQRDPIYTALSGGLTINYSIPVELNYSSALFDLLDLGPVPVRPDSARPDPQPPSTVMTIRLPATAFGIGEFTFDCGAIDTAGRYKVTLEGEEFISNSFDLFVCCCRSTKL